MTPSEITWEAVGVVIAPGGFLLAVGAQLSRLGQRNRMRNRLHQALEMLRLLPADDRSELRTALNAVVDETSIRLAKKERLWAERLVGRSERWRTRLTYSGAVATGVGAAIGAGLFTDYLDIPWSRV